jgi:hypothetical protein
MNRLRTIHLKEIRQVAAFRFYYLCGHAGLHVARRRGARAEGAARKMAERLAGIPCHECERAESGE